VLPAVNLFFGRYSVLVENSYHTLLGALTKLGKKIKPQIFWTIWFSFKIEEEKNSKICPSWRPRQPLLQPAAAGAAGFNPHR
jgi:hypothetical protein